MKKRTVKKRMKELRENAASFRGAQEYAEKQIHRIERELRARRLASAFSECLFLEFLRAGATDLELSRNMSSVRLRWLQGPIRRINNLVLLAIDKVSPRKLTRRERRSLGGVL